MTSEVTRGQAGPGRARRAHGPLVVTQPRSQARLPPCFRRHQPLDGGPVDRTRSEAQHPITVTRSPPNPIRITLRPPANHPSVPRADSEVERTLITHFDDTEFFFTIPEPSKLGPELDFLVSDICAIFTQVIPADRSKGGSIAQPLLFSLCNDEAMMLEPASRPNRTLFLSQSALQPRVSKVTSNHLT
ncbi:BZ3500_MvSof-1268-A1-R1_Chr6-3g08659 [Microbotryum saponariae]|uniref:BZ3500_MvSof-1268-A1-R1_Chr6-3g08659 protein n=1 Tax=Microbotryum saponariae TaxID=289078 RepID=A0A2X0KNA9_9BASI|nr:BZ3500_MvSof-1268-A1-R1_Chr6-3g08659 [Microbotryum saponariae]SDA07260.1 BZ3501_MvSof-1269-A2-R1_Chr6-2g08362 [Microbotryum saponariae]